VWRAGRHRLVCGDARDKEAYEALLGDERADLIFTDPPTTFPAMATSAARARIRHREFAMGVGEMSSAEFTAFREQTLASGRAVPRWTNRFGLHGLAATRVSLRQAARSYLLN
jgi:DNA modification methylase